MAGPLRRAAVILSGCGFRDGSEIFESVFLLTHLNREGAETHVFAPDAPQAAVINHLTGDVMESPRNQLLEAARIARGQIRPLSNLKPEEFDAVFLPGGFGAATNLSNFASKGSDMEVIEPLKNLLLEFKQQGKPLGFCCIAPVIAAKLFPKCSITLGRRDHPRDWPYSSAIDAAVAMKVKHVEKPVEECLVDSTNLIVTTPAYMYQGKPHEVYEGIGELVREVLLLTNLKNPKDQYRPKSRV